MGFLTGKLTPQSTFDDKTDLRAGFDRFQPEALAANQRILDLLARFAERENATLPQVALAWVRAKRPWIVPIPGTRNEKHLRENVGAIDVHLSRDDLSQIDASFAEVTVEGGRMNPEQMKVVEAVD